MNVRQLKKRRQKAKAVRDTHWPMMEDVFTYVIPFRRSTKDTGSGEDRSAEVYDHTPIISAFRFAGKLQRDFSPVDAPLYELKPGPLVKLRFGEDAHKKLAEQLEQINPVLASFNASGEWDTAFWEMGLELVGGTGFMLQLEGETDGRFARYFTPSCDEMMIEAGPYGDVAGIFWSRRWVIRAIEDAFLDVKFGPNVAKIAAKDKEAEVLLHFDVIWLGKKKRWELTVHVEDDEKQIVKPVLSRTCPWLTPRYFKVPGEVWGRGVANLAMPSIRTLNTAQRIQIMAAAIAMLGIYTAVDDGVFNPDMSPIEPGAFWKVRANGGVFGPSVQRMQPPNIDLSSIMIDDLRLNIKAGMLDDALPPDTAAVRSPTEIIERVKRLANDHLGAFGRLVNEIIVPKARRDLEIAFNKKLIPFDIKIDQLLVQVEVGSPIAQARETERVEKILNWLEIVLSISTAAQIPAKYVAKVEDALTRLGRAMQVPEDLIVGEKERGEMKAQDEAKALAMALAQAGVMAGGEGAGVPGAEAVEGVAV